MKIIAKKIKQNGWMVNDCYSFRKANNVLVVMHYVNNDRGTYSKTVSIKTFDDSEAGKNAANAIYAQKRSEGYEIKI